MVKKQKSGLPGLSSAHTIEDRRWVPLGEDVRMAQDMAARGFRIMCREQGDHVELVPLDLGLPAEALTQYFFYAWHPDMFPPNPGLEEDYQLRLKIWQQEQEKAVARPQPRPPGPKPRYDWPTQVARHLINLIRSGKLEPTPQEMAQHCVDTPGYEPDIRELQRLLKKLLD